LDKLLDYVQKRKKLFLFLTMFFITFTGCFMFPLSNYLNNFNNYFIYVIYIIYLGLLLVGLIKSNLIAVYLLTLLFTTVGIGIRYLLEYGETFAKENFNLVNILTFIVIYPASITLYYYLFIKIIPVKRDIKIDK
jgi:hypothetical protein